MFFLSLFEGVKLTLISIFYLLLPTSYTAQMRKTLTKQIYYTSIQPLTLFLFLALAFGVSLLGALISLAVEFHLQDKIGLLSIKFSVNEFAPFFTALFIALHSSPIINARLLQSRSEDSPSTQMSLDTLMIFLLPRVLGGILSALSLGVLVMVLVLSSSYIFVLFYLKGTSKN
ncbi:MAG: ABC transporter permease [Sulfurimonas sp.]|nr:ABC transporter permease [Sulfurimonas sp.]